MGQESDPGSEIFGANVSGQHGFWVDAADKKENLRQNDYYNSRGENYSQFEGYAGIKSVFIPLYADGDVSALADSDVSTVGDNMFGDYYTGQNNPTNFNGTPNYYLHPRNQRDAYSKQHDQTYDKYKAKGPLSLFTNMSSSIVESDQVFIKDQLIWGVQEFFMGFEMEGAKGVGVGLFFILATAPKTAISLGAPSEYKPLPVPK